MSLIATARALDDQRFVWRVRAATLAAAVTKYTSTDADERALAQYTLDYPLQANPTMEALVANHGAINSAIVVDASNAVNTEAITDAMITQAIGVYWAPVAKRRAERVAEAKANAANNATV